MIVPCESSAPKTVSPVSVWVSKWISPTGPRRRAIARMSGSAIEWSPPRITGSAPASTTSPTIASIASCVRTGLPGSTGGVAEVDDAQHREGIDAGLQVRAGRAARGADRARAEARADAVGDQVVGRRADDRHVDAGQFGGVLRVGHAGEGEKPGEVGLLTEFAPALERIDHPPGRYALRARARIDVDVVDLPFAAEDRGELEAHGGHVRRQQRQQVGDARGAAGSGAMRRRGRRRSAASPRCRRARAGPAPTRSASRAARCSCARSSAGSAR